jgi:hypothetical protein
MQQRSMRPRLRVPTVLAVTVLAGCPKDAPRPIDAVSDRVPDTQVVADAAVDAPPPPPPKDAPPPPPPVDAMPDAPPG